MHLPTPETRANLLIVLAALWPATYSLDPPQLFPLAREPMDANRPEPERAPTVTGILLQIKEGRPEALDRLMTVVYDELRVLAHRKLGFEASGNTLQTTALVHEAYLKLVDQRETNWENRAHFFAVAAIAMRRILVHRAEQRSAAKRGGAVPNLSLDAAHAAAGDVPDEQLLALDEALTRLEEFNERGARVVEYRFFGGLSYDEIALTMGISSITVRRAWESARAWLRRELAADFPDP